MLRITKQAAQRLPGLMFLILCLCIASLVAHVSADGLKQPGYNQVTIDYKQHHANDGDDHEESLCLADPDGLQRPQPLDSFGLSAQPVDFSLAILPLTPPPRA